MMPTCIHFVYIVIYFYILLYYYIILLNYIILLHYITLHYLTLPYIIYQEYVVRLHIAAPGTDDKRGILQGAGVACPTTESQKDCNDVMRKDLEQWLIDHGISGRGRRWREWENSVRPIESNWYIYIYIIIYTDCTISVWKGLLIVDTC